MPDPDPRDWAQVHVWRQARRQALLAARAARPTARRAAHRQRIEALLEPLLARLAAHEVSFYWPFRQEVDLRDLMARLSAAGTRLSLPVVVARERPLVFRRWHPGCALERNALGIPVPAEPVTVVPDVALVPLLGFDAACYRLGLGGGYFDRTLAAPGWQATTIGIGFECARLATIHPQPHDVALDCIVTETGVHRPTAAAAAGSRRSCGVAPS